MPETNSAEPTRLNGQRLYSDVATALIVVAHPDDAEIAMGMRMHWYARNGARVHVHCLTLGEHPANCGCWCRRTATSAESGVGNVPRRSPGQVESE